MEHCKVTEGVIKMNTITEIQTNRSILSEAESAILSQHINVLCKLDIERTKKQQEQIIDRIFFNMVRYDITNNQLPRPEEEAPLILAQRVGASEAR